MTSRPDEIQGLIADIDNLLANNGKRLSRLLSGQAQEVPEVLDRIRDFLVRLGESESLEKEAPNKPPGQGLRSPLLAKFVDQVNNQSTAQDHQPAEEQNQILPQRHSEFSTLLVPLQAELSALLQERSTLVQEIRQLEQRRLQNYSLSQQMANKEQIISEFLQVLMSRLVPSLTPYIAQNSANSAIRSTTPPLLESSDQTEGLTQLTRDLDQRLLSLDGTVNVVFDALQRNINTYQESLSQALARMHSQGIQGEQLMASFFNNLTHYLQQQSQSPESSWQFGENNTVQPASTLLTSADSLESGAVQPVINPAPQAASSTQQIDTVILPLTTSTAVTPTELRQDKSELDEVDQLYATLFGTKNVTDSNLEVAPTVVTNELSTVSQSPEVLNIADTPTVVTNELSTVSQSPEVLNIADTPVQLPINQVQPVDSAVDMSDPWVEQADVGLVERSNPNPPQIQDTPVKPTDSFFESWETLFFDEETDPIPPISLSQTPPPQVTTTESFINQPTEADTITALTDLFPNVSSNPQAQPVSPPTPSTPVVTTVAQRSEVVIDDEEADRSLDNYIPASPQENLLLPAENQVNTVADISLDAAQLQQLDRDLANFDGLLNSQSLSTTNRDIAKEQASPQEMLIENQPPTSLAEAEQITEKTTSAKNSSQESSLTVIGNDLKNPEVSAENILDSVWYLGIDLGTTGISAALLNRSTCVVYPIYWLAEKQSGATSFQQSFRLPAEVYLPTASVPHTEGVVEQTAPIDIAQDKVPTPPPKATELTNNLYSAQLKPYLQVAIPYKSTRQKWEPVLQFNEFSAGPLIWVVRSLSKLLLTLKSDLQSTTQGLTAAAVGIEKPDFASIINNITGVICTCPSNWSEQYRFNVREAILTSKLIKHPQLMQ